MTSLKKVRKVKSSEIFYDFFQQNHNLMITCYWLKLGSKEELKVGQVEEALKILYRYADILSLCLQKEDDSTWFCRMDKENIDFEVLKNKSPSDVLDEQMSNNFNSKEGPLWRVKYIINSEKTTRDYDELKPELQNAEKLTETNELKLHDEFESDIIFCFNHVFSDGHTAFNICNSFLEALNDVVGETVKDIYDFGKLNDGRESEEMNEERLIFFKNNPDIFDELKVEMEEINKDEAIIGEIFPVPKDIINKTKHMYRDLDNETTSKLIKVFKDHGVTFNSGFTALVNWALIEVLTENGLSLESLDIGAFHTLNLRRYWKKYSGIKQGSQVGGISIKTKTEKNVGNRFWEYALEIHEIIKNHILQRRPIDENVYRTEASPFKDLKEFSEMVKNPPTPKLYYSSTNMGDVGSMLKGRGKHVSINWLSRCTSAHTGHICMTHITQTYEGKFLYGFGYYTKFITDDFANKYINKIFDKIYYLSN